MCRGRRPRRPEKGIIGTGGRACISNRCFAASSRGNQMNEKISPPNLKLPNRKQIRLQGYDYSSEGAYFLTLCTENRKNYFGKIEQNGLLSEPRIRLSRYGEILQNQLAEINETYTHLAVVHYAIMPNHLHMIVFVENGASGTPPPTKDEMPTHSIQKTPVSPNAAIPALISTLKRFTNKKANTSLWQRGYYDRILRDENEYLYAWQYIEENPFGKG